MKDVAELVGVSIQTVSAVINNKPGITSETRARVLAAVEQLGYYPYSVARSLRTGQTRTLALIVSDLSNPSFGCNRDSNNFSVSSYKPWAKVFKSGIACLNVQSDGVDSGETWKLCWGFPLCSGFEWGELHVIL